MDTHDPNDLGVTVADHIAVVTLDRAPVNAQSRAMRESLIRVMDEFCDRDDVRVVVLTGAGKCFSAGADIKERAGFSGEPGRYVSHNRLTRESFYAIEDCAKPVIGAINGPAIGAGTVLALSCDILVASNSAWFQMPEVDVGMSGGMKLLERHLSRHMARYFYYTGRKIPAAELHRLGILQACVEPAELMPAAMRIAAEIAEKSPLAVRRAKAGFNTGVSMPDREAYRYEQQITIELSRSDDTREAQQAFIEKRKPRFTGR